MARYRMRRSKGIWDGHHELRFISWKEICFKGPREKQNDKIEYKNLERDIHR